MRKLAATFCLLFMFRVATIVVPVDGIQVMLFGTQLMSWIRRKL